MESNVTENHQVDPSLDFRPSVKIHSHTRPHSNSVLRTNWRLLLGLLVPPAAMALARTRRPVGVRTSFSLAVVVVGLATTLLDCHPSRVSGFAVAADLADELDSPGRHCAGDGECLRDAGWLLAASSAFQQQARGLDDGEGHAVRAALFHESARAALNAGAFERARRAARDAEQLCSVLLNPRGESNSESMSDGDAAVCAQVMHTAGCVKVLDADFVGAAKLHTKAKQLDNRTPPIVATALPWLHLESPAHKNARGKFGAQDDSAVWTPFADLLFQLAVSKKVLHDAVTDAQGNADSQSVQRVFAEVDLSLGHAIHISPSGSAVNLKSCAKATLASGFLQRALNNPLRAAEVDESALRFTTALAAAHCDAASDGRWTAEDETSTWSSAAVGAGGQTEAGPGAPAAPSHSDRLAFMAARLACTAQTSIDGVATASAKLLKAAHGVAGILRLAPRLAPQPLAEAVDVQIAELHDLLHHKSPFGVFVHAAQPSEALAAVMGHLPKHFAADTPVWVFTAAVDLEELELAAYPLNLTRIHPTTKKTSGQQHDQFLTNPDFYEAFPADMMLILETSSMLCDNPTATLAEFMHHDMCGAPQPPSTLAVTNGHGRSGGFSLRRTSVMASILRTHPGQIDTSGKRLQENWHLGMLAACDDLGSAARPQVHSPVISECPAYLASQFAWQKHADFAAVPLGIDTAFAYMPWRGHLADICEGLPDLPRMQQHPPKSRYADTWR